MKTYFLSILSWCLILGIVIAGTIDPTVPDDKYLDYGSKFTYVGKICGIDKDGTKFCGSGVAIDDHFILTAAHVVKDTKSCHFILESGTYAVSEVTIHSDFGSKFGIADIAIGYSEKPLNLKFYPELYDQNDEDGKLCCISGYGLTGNFRTGAKTSDNKKRAGSNIVDYISDDMLVCSVRHIDTHKTSLEFLIASGDSGGGLFIDNKLAGINSCVMASGRNSPSSKYEEESGHTRVSKFIPWINKIRKK
jgi:hypothetical protein